MHRKPLRPANVMALTALCVSIAFSSLPSAMADTVATAAKATGIVKRAKSADNAKKLGGLKPIKANSKAARRAGSAACSGRARWARVFAQAFCATA